MNATVPVQEAARWLGSLSGAQQFGIAVVASALFVWLFLAVGRGLRRWWNRQKIASRVEAAATSPEAPELNPDREAVIFTAQGFSPVEKAADIILELSVLATNAVQGRRIDSVEIALTASTDEQWEMMALRHVKDAHGVHFLPARVSFPIQLHLAMQYLQWADAPDGAQQLVRARLESVDKSNFYACLFNPATLAEIDQTPATGGGETYFKKYFQPLMVSFSQKAFSKSAGEVEERDALYEHLVLLSNHRVAAAKLTESHPQVDPAKLLRDLPQPIPTAKFAKKVSRAAAARWNRNDAVSSVLVISEPQTLADAQLLERAIQAKWVASTSPFFVWTPVVDPAPEQACFLWQVREN